MRRILIHDARIVNEGRTLRGYLLVEGERIAAVGEGDYTAPFEGERIDAAGAWVMPGVIDDQVHFREPGLTRKATIRSESAAALAGGVTSYMEMPNTVPAAVTLETLEHKYAIAERDSAANYSFYLGATEQNADQIRRMDPRRICGVKLFMGSSTGNMLVEDERALAAIFAESPVVVATHCEDERRIRSRAAKFRSRYGDRIEPAMHALVRDAEACYRSTARAVELAERYGAHLHVLHLSTARELGLFSDGPLAEKRITNEVCLHHLWFCDEDYARLGNRIKWNPSIKSAADRDALRRGVACGRVDVVATDHAPHLAAEKALPYWECPSGGPSVQHSLPAMMTLAARGLWTPEQVVERMCHAPAVRFRVRERGFLRVGYRADVVVVEPREQVVEAAALRYRCGWSPFEGERLTATVRCTLLNGRIAYRDGRLDEGVRGERLEFDR